MKFEYLAVLLITVTVPFIKSFSKEINFYFSIKRLIYSLHPHNFEKNVVYLLSNEY